MTDPGIFPWQRRRHDEARARLLLAQWRDLHDMLLPSLLDTQSLLELQIAIAGLMSVVPPQRVNGGVSAAKRRIAARIRVPPAGSRVEMTNLAQAYGIVALWLESQTLEGADATAVREETAAIINAALREAPQP